MIPRRVARRYDIDSRGGVSRTIVFKPGRNGLTPTTKMVSVKVFPDGNPEADETFGVAVWHVQSVAPVALRDQLAQGTVINDDERRRSTDRGRSRRGDRG